MSEETIKAALDGALQPDRAALLRNEVERLTKLDHAGYLVERKEIATNYKIPAKDLDKLIEAARPATPVAGREPMAPPAPEPHAEAVHTPTLLDELCAFIKRFVILDQHALVAVALWVVFTYCFEIAETSPRLRLKSPDKRCGKTRLLEVLSLLIPHSIAASNLSPSTIFRTIDLENCTLLIDEADTFVRTRKDGGNEDLRGLLNSGHTRATAYVIRSVPAGEKAWQPKRFSTWCPLAIAGIGGLPDTVEDRSITILMRRKLRNEKVERLTRRNKAARADAVALASKLARFAADNLDKLREADPASPETLNDRATDNWEHLLAIADLAGGDWTARARTAAVKLSGDREDGDAESLHTKLLSDIKAIFEALPESTAELRSKDICEKLTQIETSPWAEMGRGGKPITQARLARMLKSFEIYVTKIDNGNARGYQKSNFSDSFERYLATIPPTQCVKVSETLGREGETDDFRVSSEFTQDTLENAATPTPRMASDTWTASEGGMDAHVSKAFPDVLAATCPPGLCRSQEDAEIDRVAAEDGWNPNADKGEIK